MTPPLFLVAAGSLADTSPGSVVVVDGDEGRHAVSVRRLRVGEPVSVGDGCGVVAAGVVSAVHRASLAVAVSSVDVSPQPADRFVVVQALARGGRDEAAVESMTEVGVDEVIGWEASRCVAKWTDRTCAKWSSIARAATKQSRRAWVPSIGGPITMTHLTSLVASASLALVLDSDAPDPLSSLKIPEAGSVVVIVGPEGGITADEQTALISSGAVAASLGPNVLRSSTAGTAAIAILSAVHRWR